MRHYIFCIFLLTAFGTQAQQVNPVPDYVFRNQMSVGRNAVTDTAAYMSIGPRYGANKGLMPPIVSDTAAITGVKRNGLLIFSVQRNNFQYWDSINSRWTSVTANVDTTVISTRAWRKKGDDSLGAVIATRTDTTLLSTRAWRKKGDDSLGAVIATRTDTTLLSTRAWRKKGDDSLGAVIATRTDTTLLSTRAWRQKGLDSLAAIEIDGNGTLNYVPKFTASRTLGNSQIFDNGTLVGINTTNLTHRLRVFGTGRFDPSATRFIYIDTAAHTTLTNLTAAISFSRSADGADNMAALFGWNNGGIALAGREGIALATGGSVKYPETTERLRIFANGRVGINTTTDAGYQFDVAGSMRNTTGANFATSSGSVGIGTTSPSEALHVVGRGRFTTIDSTSSPINVLTSDVNGVIRKTAPGVQGSGTTNYLPKFTGTTTLGNSVAFDNGSEILINTTSDAGDFRLQVNGNANFRDDVLIDTNLRVNRHISLDQTPKAWALGNAIEGPQGSTLFVAGGGVQTLANIYYDGSYKYSTSNPGAAMFLLQSGITFATYGSGTANGALTGANEMVYAGGELRVGLADQGTFKLQVADKSYFGDEVQIASTTDLGNYKLQVTGEAIITAGIRTDAPSGGTAATWKLGTVATVSPTSPNRTIEVEIGGTTYYIHAKTTNN